MSETVEKVTAPKNVEEVGKITALKTTEASTSYARFLNTHLDGVEGWTAITDEQAWAAINVYRAWQSSDERKEEKEALLKANAEAREARKAEREEQAEERKAKAAEKKAETARRKAEREARKKAEAEDSIDDLDSVEASGDGEIPAPKKRRRRPAPKADTSIDDLDESIDDVQPDNEEAPIGAL